MPELYDQIQEAVATVKQHWPGKPSVGIILGTGLGGLAEDVKREATIPYETIPHFPRSTVMSHAGQLLCGQIGGQAIVAMEGRFHFYEGYSLKQITFPVRVLKALGCTYLIVSKNLIEAAAVGVLFAFRTGRIAGLDALRRRTARSVVSAGEAAA